MTIGKDRQQLTDEVPADTAQVRCPREPVGDQGLLAAEDMANDLFAVLGVNLRRIHSAVGQPVPVPSAGHPPRTSVAGSDCG
jgi:hypothetical protein